MKNLLITAFTAMLLTACGSETELGGDQNPKDEDLPTTETPADFTPESKTIQTLNLIDIEGNPIPNADISITQVTTEAKAISQSFTPRALPTPSLLSTDSEGQLNVDDLAPGTYVITLTLGETEISFTIVINASNSQAETTVAAPIIMIENDLGEPIAIDASENGVFFSISGVIHDDEGPIEQAQVELSGGASTNGAIATTITDSEGNFILIINVGAGNLEALKSASLRIFKEGYDSTTENNINAVDVASITGLSIQLAAKDSSGNIYSEGFDQVGSEATCGNWVSYTTEASLGESVSLEMDLWHQHQAGLNILNNAFEYGLVLLAPNDNSEGYIPDPVSGQACWYGEAASGGLTQGNFLGQESEDEYSALDELPLEELEENDLPTDGGTSNGYHSAAIESPAIDLSAETAPLSLNFRTWWEIESTNPNNAGFDLMTIQYQIQGEDSQWVTLARLNPLSDPVSTCDVDRAPIPYSNAGYNKAPLWLWQEPISLDNLAGNVIKLRFNFSTEDGLYNGFRGWLVDDLSIQKTEGTFPLYEESNQDGEENAPMDNCISIDEPELEEVEPS